MTILLNGTTGITSPADVIATSVAVPTINVQTINAGTGNTLLISSNVGIGITNPQVQFEIYGVGGDVIQLQSDLTTSGNSGTGNGIIFGGSDGSVSGRLFGRIGVYKENSTAGDVSSYMSFQTRLHPSGTVEKARLTSAGNLQFVQNGAGIIFDQYSGTSGALNNSTLNDYEIGTWTPSLGGTATYTAQSARYTKIGNVVTIELDMTVSTIGTGSTTTITGLPFTVAASPGGAVYVGYYSNLATSVTFLNGRLDGSGTYITMQGTTGNINIVGSSAIFGNGARVNLSATYQTTF
jgi:hypothetical protein